eukprot:5184195-Prymnesium_polylepis.1
MPHLSSCLNIDLRCELRRKPAAPQATCPSVPTPAPSPPCPQGAIAIHAAGQRAADGTTNRAAGQRATTSNHHEDRNA